MVCERADGLESTFFPSSCWRHDGDCARRYRSHRHHRHHHHHNVYLNADNGADKWAKNRQKQHLRLSNRIYSSIPKASVCLELLEKRSKCQLVQVEIWYVFFFCSYSFMPASHGCSPRWMASFPPFSRDLSHRHAFLTHLYMVYLPFYAFLFACSLIDRSRPYSCVCACVCVWAFHGKWAVLAMLIPLLFHTVDNNCARSTESFTIVSIYCVAVIRYAGSLVACRREWRSVPWLQWRRGCCFFAGLETARYARWCNTYKGVFSSILPQYTPFQGSDTGGSISDGLIWITFHAYTIGLLDNMKVAHPCPCNGAHSQDGKGALIHMRTTFICCMWHSSVSPVFNPAPIHTLICDIL